MDTQSIALTFSTNCGQLVLQYMTTYIARSTEGSVLLLNFEPPSTSGPACCHPSQAKHSATKGRSGGDKAKHSAPKGWSGGAKA